MYAIIQGKIPERPTSDYGRKLTGPMWDCLVQCWTRRPQGRPTVAEMTQIFRPPDLTPDVEAVLALLRDRKPLELESDQVHAIAEVLDNVRWRLSISFNYTERHAQFLSELPATSSRRTPALIGLQQISRYITVLPASCRIVEGSLILEEYPSVQSEFADTHKGVYGPAGEVAVKILRVIRASNEMYEIKKVRLKPHIVECNS